MPQTWRKTRKALKQLSALRYNRVEFIFNECVFFYIIDTEQRTHAISRLLNSERNTFIRAVIIQTGPDSRIGTLDALYLVAHPLLPMSTSWCTLCLHHRLLSSHLCFSELRSTTISDGVSQRNALNDSIHP